jgi:inositol phosphorylceramide synthase catalytic subunit
LKGYKFSLKDVTASDRFSNSSVLFYLIIMGIYSLWVFFLLDGFRPDHYLLIIGVTTIYFFNKTSRKLVLGLGFLIIMWFLYDSLRLFPNYEFNTIHIGELYQLEKALFGIQTLDKVVTANEFFDIHNHPFFDIYTAIIYISYVPAPIILGSYLFFSKRRITMVHFFFTFLLVCLTGWTFHYIYPAAPPWYVEMYGVDSAFQKVPGNPARLINFDKYFGVNIFSTQYSLNGNVYAAVPSLHCAYPIIQLYFVIKNKLKWGILFYIIFMLSTWFSAVYTNHHYIIDVLCGIGTALLAITIYNLLLKTKFKTFLDNYGKWIS